MWNYTDHQYIRPASIWTVTKVTTVSNRRKIFYFASMSGKRWKL